MGKILLLLFLVFTFSCGYVKYSVNGVLPPLFIATDYSNHRVLLWNKFPSQYGDSADIVLGQPDMNTTGPNTGGISAQSAKNPEGALTDGTRLYIADSNNNRILIWNSIPSVNQQPADIVLGQPGMGTGTANFGGSRNAQTLSYPIGLLVSGGRFYAVDAANRRVLIWNAPPTVNQQSADLVLGQTSMTVASSATTPQTTTFPSSISSDGTHLFVVDAGANRVMVWNTIPTVSSQAADFVLGQPDMTSFGPNTGGANLGMNGPVVVCNESGHLFVNDRFNHRVLIWNSIPTRGQQPADLVLGQPDLTTVSSSSGPSGMNNPLGLFCSGGKLMVSDFGNNRILIWNSLPTRNQQPADLVLCQLDMNSVSSGAGAQNCKGPDGLTANFNLPGVFRSGGY
jgi:hypothetical protein